MQAFLRRRDCCQLYNVALRLAIGQHGKHTSAKLKRAKFDNTESYKTFARRHNRRKHNESLKQQAEKVWVDPWESSRKSNRREAQGVHLVSDEALWQMMFEGATASPKADKQQRKAWKAWTKQFEQASHESEAFQFTYQHASDDRHASRSAKSDKRHQQEWADWQGHTFKFSSWEGDFEGWYHAGNNSNTSHRQARADRQQQKAEQQAFNVSFAQNSRQRHQCMRLLGVSVLEPSLLKQAFLECAKRWHPDKHADDAKAAAEIKFKEAQSAYQYLLTCL